jgi:hypothetical protein
MSQPTTREADALLDLLSKPIAFHRAFVKIGGSVAAAVMLSQAFYWSRNKASVARDGWFYKPHSEWEEETGLSRREQQTARKHLRERGLLEERDGSVKGKGRVLWYRVNRAALFEALQGLAGPPEEAEDTPVRAHRSARPVAPQRPTPLRETAQPVAPQRPTPLITSETTAETTPQGSTHTRSAGACRAAEAPAEAADAGVCVPPSRSRFSFPERKVHMQANGLTWGWLQNSEDGRYDALIEAQRAAPDSETVIRARTAPRSKADARMDVIYNRLAELKEEQHARATVTA